VAGASSRIRFLTAISVLLAVTKLGQARRRRSRGDQKTRPEARNGFVVWRIPPAVPARSRAPMPCASGLKPLISKPSRCGDPGQRAPCGTSTDRGVRFFFPAGPPLFFSRPPGAGVPGWAVTVHALQLTGMLRTPTTSISISVTTLSLSNLVLVCGCYGLWLFLSSRARPVRARTLLLF